MKSREVVPASTISPTEPAAPPDRLSTLLEHFRVRASLFHAGSLCGRHTFAAVPGRAFLHVLRRGALTVEHARGQGVAPRLRIDEPTVLLYARPLWHVFVNPPRDGADFTCATLDFDGGERNPIVRALPALVHVPLRDVGGLQPALDLLFAETERPRCGSRLLADRLFEVVLIQLLRWIVDQPQRAGVGHGLLAGLADPRLARALVALHEAPEQDWPLARMAAVAGMSRSAFAAALKQAIGTTPAAYLSDWRLSLATSRLRGGQPLKQIAADLGFAGAASLSKAFRQRLGSSPREWLRQQAAGDLAG